MNEIKYVDFNNLWGQIKKEFSENPRDVKTTPLGNRIPVWFYVSCSNTDVIISSGREHENKSVIRGTRILNKNELKQIFLIYQQRKNGQSVSAKSTQITINSVYWYGIFAELGY